MVNFFGWPDFAVLAHVEAARQNAFRKTSPACCLVDEMERVVAAISVVLSASFLSTGARADAFTASAVLKWTWRHT